MMSIFRVAGQDAPPTGCGRVGASCPAYKQVLARILTPLLLNDEHLPCGGKIACG